MFSILRLYSIRTPLYSILTFLAQISTTAAMQEITQYGIDTLQDHRVTQRQVGKDVVTTLEGVSRAEFESLMSGIIDNINKSKNSPFEEAKSNGLPSRVLDCNKDPYYQKGQIIIDTITSITLAKYDKEKSTRLEQMRVRQFNNDLRQNNLSYTIDFNEILRRNKITSNDVNKLYNLAYGYQKLETDYFDSMANSLRKELDDIEMGKLSCDGYATDFIDPKATNARRRFVKDAIDILNLKTETSRNFEKQLEAAQSTFYSFTRLYLGYIRDLTGCLFAREQALYYTCQELETDQDLSDIDLQARWNVMSLLYLGQLERTFQVLEVLQPLAEAAYKVKATCFDRKIISEQISFARKTMNDLFSQKHNILLPEEFTGPLPTEVPLKPISKRQQKKLNQEKKVQEAILHQQETQLSTSSKSGPVDSSFSIKSTSSKQREQKPTETVSYNDWFDRTGGENRSLKNDYRFPTEEQVSKERKAQAKKEKQNSSTPTNQEKAEKTPIEINGTEEKTIKERIPLTMHSPHKNGSKILPSSHVKDIRGMLIEAGYTPDVCINRKILEMSSGAWKVFQAIHDLSFYGEMHEVCNMIEQLEGHVDETRSGSRVALMLRHISKRSIVGIDLMLR